MLAWVVGIKICLDFFKKCILQSIEKQRGSDPAKCKNEINKYTNPHKQTMTSNPGWSSALPKLSARHREPVAAGTSAVGLFASPLLSKDFLE